MLGQDSTRKPATHQLLIGDYETDPNPIIETLLGGVLCGSILTEDADCENLRSNSEGVCPLKAELRSNLPLGRTDPNNEQP